MTEQKKHKKNWTPIFYNWLTFFFYPFQRFFVQHSRNLSQLFPPSFYSFTLPYAVLLSSSVLVFETCLNTSETTGFRRDPSEAFGAEIEPPAELDRLRGGQSRRRKHGDDCPGHRRLHQDLKGVVRGV